MAVVQLYSFLSIVESVQHFEYLDIKSLNTPIKIAVLAKWLKRSNYEETEANFLIDGFKNGFDLDYNGPRQRCDLSRNIPFSIGNKTVMWNKIMKEVSL